MAKTFLTAEWRNLVMANYQVDAGLLQKYLPTYTELDTFNNMHFVSLVAFFFDKVKVRGIAFPFHTRFEEVNLRFYVKFKDKNTWKRGVVFINEMVPRRMISFIANTLYGENYTTHPMKHEWQETENELAVNYEWKAGQEWNHINCIAEKEAAPIASGSAEEFITEHYWGYTFINQKNTGVYEVAHPRWKIHKIKSFDIVCNAKLLYSEAFAATLEQTPHSVFLADGSAVKVMKGARITGK